MWNSLGNWAQARRSDWEEAQAVTYARVTWGNLHFRGMHWLIIKKRVLHIFDLVDSDPNINESISGGNQTVDINTRIILGIDLDHLECIILFRTWRRGRHISGLFVTKRVIAWLSDAYKPVEYKSLRTDGIPSVIWRLFVYPWDLTLWQLLCWLHQSHSRYRMPGRGCASCLRKCCLHLLWARPT